MKPETRLPCPCWDERCAAKIWPELPCGMRFEKWQIEWLQRVGLPKPPPEQTYLAQECVCCGRPEHVSRWKRIWERLWRRATKE